VEKRPANRGGSRFVVAAVLSAFAIAISGCGNGDTGDRTEAEPRSSLTPVADGAQTGSDQQMPDLVGLQEDQAIELLESAGIDDYDFVELGSLNRPGEVLKQLPSAGSAIRGKVTLTVAVPLPPMPDYTGMRVGDARSELEAWGVSVIEEYELTLDRPSDEVIGTTPSAGDEIGSEVVLQVAVAPVIGSLGAEAPEVAKDGFDYPREGSIQINGELYEKSVYVSGWANAGELAYAEYNLGRDWEFFETTVGLLDDSSFEQGGRFRIVLDGSVIWEKDLEFGQAETVSINVSDGLRLRLEAVSLHEGAVGLGWGDAQLLGIPGEAPVGSQSSDDG